MPIGFPSSRLLPAFAAFAFMCWASPPGWAADVSPWDEDIRSAARLVAGGAPTGSGEWRAGVEIKLMDGWKTYWRYPGDSGVPPILDFSGSDNVNDVAVFYPGPTRFPDGAGGQSIGYKGDVIWPLRVTPKDARKPVVLRLKLDYAACEKLCVPAKAAAELSLDAHGSSAPNAALAAAEAGVPTPGRVGDGQPLSIKAVHRESGTGKPKIVVDVAAPPSAAVDLFAEGPTGDWALPLPEPVAGAPPGITRFAFALDGLPPGGKADGATLRLTAVSGGRAVEAAFHLD